MAQDQAVKLRVVAFKDGDGWIAQCLEYDISAQAPDLDSLIRRMNLTINAEAEYTSKEHGEPFSGIDPAPEYFTAMFDSVQAALCGPLDSNPGTEMRIAA